MPTRIYQTYRNQRMHSHKGGNIGFLLILRIFREKTQFCYKKIAAFALLTHSYRARIDFFEN